MSPNEREGKEWIVGTARQLDHITINALREENARLRAALEEITLGAGPFSRDHLTHASNTIEAMKEIARSALAAKNNG